MAALMMGGGSHDVGLEIRNLDVVYGHAARALVDISITVDPGAFVVVLGPNGAGKTTLVRAVTRLLPLHGGSVRRGSISLGGRSILQSSPRDVVRAGVCQVPEGRMVFAGLTVEDNLRVGAASRKDRRAIATEVERALERFPALGRRRHHPAGVLSGGEQQILAIARALLARPRLIVIDELSLGLAPKMVDEVFALVSSINADGTGVVLIEQSAKRALHHADYVYVFMTGQCRYQGTADEIRASTDVKNLYLGGGATEADSGIGAQHGTRSDFEVGA